MKTGWWWLSGGMVLLVFLAWATRAGDAVVSGMEAATSSAVPESSAIGQDEASPATSSGGVLGWLLTGVLGGGTLMGLVASALLWVLGRRPAWQTMYTASS